MKSSLPALILTVVAGARGVGELHGAGPGSGGARHHREGHQRAGGGDTKFLELDTKVRNSKLS